MSRAERAIAAACLGLAMFSAHAGDSTPSAEGQLHPLTSYNDACAAMCDGGIVIGSGGKTRASTTSLIDGGIVIGSGGRN